MRWSGIVDDYFNKKTLSEAPGVELVNFGCHDMTAIVIYSVNFGLSSGTVKGPFSLKHLLFANLFLCLLIYSFVCWFIPLLANLFISLLIYSFVYFTGCILWRAFHGTGNIHQSLRSCNSWRISTQWRSTENRRQKSCGYYNYSVSPVCLVVCKRYNLKKQAKHVIVNH